jgi:uncharacterized membrane protein YfcA
MIRYLFSRIGCLMLIAGTLTLVVGIAAVQSEQPAFTLLLVGFLVTLLGFLLWNRLRPKGQRNTRFSKFRRRESRQEEKKDNGWEDRFYG